MTSSGHTFIVDDDRGLRGIEADDRLAVLAEVHRRAVFAEQP